MPRKRDYKAEYNRRIERAQSRGFTNYYDQRSKIERGIAPAISPGRLRKRETIERQEQRFGPVIGGKQSDFFTRLDPTKYRIEMAKSWADYHGRSEATTQFDPERAKRDPDYLETYLQGIVMPALTAEKTHHFERSEHNRRWLVDITGWMTDEEYDERYGKE